MASVKPTVSLPKETPCGCIQEAVEREESGGKAKCTCASCGEHCRCAELKPGGKCDCAKRLEAHETTAMGWEERVPKGCIVEAGVTDAEACPTCGVQGCHCIDLKGRCDCVAAK